MVNAKKFAKIVDVFIGRMVTTFNRLPATLAVLLTVSPLAPFTKYAKLIFTISTNGISIFDSYTACIALLNVLVAQLVTDTEKNNT